MADRVLSASQINTWLRPCKRIWGFTYLEDKRSEANAGAKLGSQIHEELENWLKNWPAQETISLSPIASAMARLAPRPTLDMKVEEPFLTEIDGVKFRGFIDWAIPPVEFGDWKTTKDAKWAKTTESLPEDVQYLLYARHLDIEKATWIYGITSNPGEAFTVEVDPPKAQNREKFKLNVLAPAQEILTCTATEGNSLKADYDECRKFGGCPHLSYCHRPAKDQLRQSMKKSKTLLVPETIVHDLPPTPVKDPVEDLPAAPAQATLAQGKPIGTLYVNCLPLGQMDGLVFAHELLAKAVEEVCADAQVLHPKLIKYSEGDGMLAAQMRDLIQTTPVKALHLSTKGSEAYAVLQTLMSLADNVVMGV